jgi:F-type H+-transporting ATPase subunit gamma
VVIAFTSDRGLCGGFNNNLNRMVYAQARAGELGGDVELVIFGRTGNDFFRRREIPIHRALVHLREAERRISIKEEVTEEIIGRFLSGEVGRVLLAFNRFENAIRQSPMVRPLLPITPPEADEEEVVDDREVLFEPSRREILDSLLPSYLENQGLIAHLNTEAGEHGARMVAMEGATKNAGEMISSLTLQYNRLRQAVITRELIEIISGAQGL